MAIEIISAASSVPEKILANSELEKMVETTDAWIAEKVGIKERRIYSEGESALDSLQEASQKIFTQTGIDPNDVGLIVIASSTTEQIMPSTACLLQEKLGIKNCIAFDIQAACSGFVYATSIAYALMKDNAAIKYALVFGSEVLSRVTDWTDRNTCVLFGDGVGGVLLANNPAVASGEGGILGYHLGSDGVGSEHLGVGWGVAKGYDVITPTSKYIYMNGRRVFKSSVEFFVHTAEQVLAQTGYSLDQVDWVVPHQANLRIISAVAKRMGVPLEKFVNTIDKYGNTSAASIPMALGWHQTHQPFKKGQLVLLIGFGAGFTWGSVLYRVS